MTYFRVIYLISLISKVLKMKYIEFSLALLFQNDDPKYPIYWLFWPKIGHLFNLFDHVYNRIHTLLTRFV